MKIRTALTASGLHVRMAELARQYNHIDESERKSAKGVYIYKELKRLNELVLITQR